MHAHAHAASRLGGGVRLILETAERVLVAGRAELVEEGREVAWAERYVRHQSDLAWVHGNYVCADTPNYNGHVFPLEDLQDAHKNIANKPLNLLHRSQQIVGNYVGAELLYPTKATDAALAEAASAPAVPYVDSIAVLYRYYFPETYQAIRKAHAEGTLYMSMECVPKSLTCLGNGDGSAGCQRVFDYRGRQHDSYCDHLNAPGAHKRMNKPLFTAGALVIPPARPGWKDADVTEMSQLLAEIGDTELEAAYQQVSGELPHLDPKDWESMMGRVVQAAAGQRADLTTLDDAIARGGSRS